MSDWKNSHRLSESLASRGIMGTHQGPSLSPLIRQCCDIPRGFWRALVMPRDASLSDSCTSNRCSFSSMDEMVQTGNTRTLGPIIRNPLKLLKHHYKMVPRSLRAALN